MRDHDWPKWSEMHALRLTEGPGDGIVLPIAPTMRHITHAGERYFRMDKTRSRLGDGSYGGAYLWSRWCDEVLLKRVAFDSGHCVHRVRSDGSAKCNAGGRLGKAARAVDEAEIEHRKLAKCRICFRLELKRAA